MRGTGPSRPSISSLSRRFMIYNPKHCFVHVLNGVSIVRSISMGILYDSSKYSENVFVMGEVSAVAFGIVFYWD